MGRRRFECPFYAKLDVEKAKAELDAATAEWHQHFARAAASVGDELGTAPEGTQFEQWASERLGIPHERVQAARERLKQAQGAHQRAASLGFHRDPGELDDDEVYTIIRTYAGGEDWNRPRTLLVKLTDLTARATWPRWQPEPPPQEWFRYRDAVIRQFASLSTEMRTAWDSLEQLFIVLRDRGEVIPEPLQEWVNRFAYRRFKRMSRRELREVEPPKARGQAREDERDLRIWTVFKWLEDGGWKLDRSVAAIAHALAMNESTVRSVYEKMRRIWAAVAPK